MIWFYNIKFANIHKYILYCRFSGINSRRLFWISRPIKEFFTHMEMSPLLQILIYARYFWPLSSRGSLECYTYFDTGHPFIFGQFRGPLTLTPIAELLTGELSLPVLRLRSGFDHPTFRLRHRRNFFKFVPNPIDIKLISIQGLKNIE